MTGARAIGSRHRLNPLASLAELSGVVEVLAVVAHPDDESFGLGGILAALVLAGVKVRLLCLTAGEASTIGAGSDLAARRRIELGEAAERLGIATSHLESLPDGGLSDLPAAQLPAMVAAHLAAADAVAVFEPGGVTGHPDHCAASRAAGLVADQHGLITLEWGLAQSVADSLRLQFGAPFLGFEAVGNWPVEIVVDRELQRSAIACHRSQEPDNPVLQRRLDLESDRELIRVRSAPYDARLRHFVERAAPLARPTASRTERMALLRLLVGFAAGATWPEALWDGESSSGRVLWDASGEWTLRSQLTTGDRPLPGQVTHCSWGAVATVAGVEAYHPLARVGSGDAEIRPTNLVARGGGYLHLGARIPGSPEADSGTLASVSLVVN
ncbi:MAG: PIG-L deacetylase family protein [Candidatus Dormibacteria bacterium]